MTRQNPTFTQGVEYLAIKGLKVTEPTVRNHCYKHIDGYEKRKTHKLDTVENYGGQITENATIPHSFDPQRLRNKLGVQSTTDDSQSVKEVISRGLSKSIELSTLSLVNALEDHSKGLRQYPIDMVRGLKDLVAISTAITTCKPYNNARFESVLDVSGLIKTPVKEEIDILKLLEDEENTVTVWK